jgi:2-methylcitrate dehydratase
LHVADAIACAIAAADSDAALIARRIALRTSSDRARVIGQGSPVALESATLWNTVMIRYLDLNDSYNQIGSGHPSDLVGVALAAATDAGRTGAELLAAIDAAYDCLCDLWNQSRIGRVGWDQGTMVGPVAAATAGSLLGLTQEQIGHAVAMSAVSGVALRQTRLGQLSMWKGMATGHSAKMAASAVLLAQQGASGPPEPFVGVDALGAQVFPAAPLPISLSGAMLTANLKGFPCCFHAQGPAELAARARRVVDPDDVTAVEVATYEKASSLADDESKWHPELRETADHSLPFLIAVSLIDGGLSEASFANERWFEPKTVAMMQKIRVTIDPALTAAFPDKVASQLRVHTSDGENRFVDELDHPLGHHKRPIEPDEVGHKFLGLTRDSLGDERAEYLYATLMDLENVTDLGALVDATVPR